MNPGRDAVILIIILAALGVAIFSINASPEAAENLRRSSLAPSPQQNSVSSPSLTKAELRQMYLDASPQSSSVRPDETEEQRIERQIAEAEAELALVEARLEEIEKYGEESPYKGMITIARSMGGPRSKDVSREYVQLNANRQNESRVNISDWRLQSSVTGRGAEIGDAVGLFFSGEPNAETPLYLKPNEKAYIITGRSPIGESFQVNKCSGYFNQFQTFYPNISSRCPTPEEEIEYYTRDRSIFSDDACLDFVERIPRCTVQTKQLPLNLSFACQDAILEEISYNSCIEKHKDDADFYSGDWRVYLKRSNELWKDKREIILLLDENGKTVDYYTY